MLIAAVNIRSRVMLARLARLLAPVINNLPAYHRPTPSHAHRRLQVPASIKACVSQAGMGRTIGLQL